MLLIAIVKNGDRKLEKSFYINNAILSNSPRGYGRLYANISVQNHNDFGMIIDSIQQQQLQEKLRKNRIVFYILKTRDTNNIYIDHDGPSLLCIHIR